MELSIYLEGDILDPCITDIEQALDANPSVGAYYSERKELVAEYGGLPPAFFFEQNHTIIKSVRQKELQHTDVMVVVGLSRGLTPEMNQAINDGIPLVLISNKDDDTNHKVLPYVRYILDSLDELASFDFYTC